jgi:23S rRNA (adenine-N6)-dimethyltransferase
MSASLRQSALLSQNFLTDSRLVVSLLDRFAPGGDGDHGVVYEIGPGEGIITRQLALRYRQVVAIEKDQQLATYLIETFSGWPNVTIRAGDFLREPLPHSPYIVFANIPFNITAAIVTKLTAAETPPDVAYLVMQREAAAMFMGKPHESLRTILLKPWFETEIVYRFQRSDFAPAPRVDVVMLRLRKRGPPLVSNADRQFFRDFVVYVFTHWQPNRINPLTNLFTWRQCARAERILGFDLSARPTSLTLTQWLCLFERLKSAGNRDARQRLAGSERRLLRQQARLEKQHRTRAGRQFTPPKM